MKIGINSTYLGINNTCCGYDKALKMLPDIKRAGFTHVMLTEGSGNIENQIKEAQIIGLEVSCIHLYGETKEEILKSLKSYSKFGIKTFISHPLPLGILDKPFCLAEKLGLKIAIENTENSHIEQLEYLLDCGASCVGFCYDIGHHFVNSPNKDFLKRYGSLFACSHIHDNDLETDLHLLPFDGKIDFSKIKLPTDKPLILEVYKNTRLGTPHPPYKNLTDQQYLALAYERAQKLHNIISL